jgi:outer membrane protein insertion porin family
VDLSFYRLTYQNQHYFSLTKDLVLMLNAELGYANGLQGQTLPFYKNFYAGGVNSVRGYDTASLGPVDPLYPDTRLGGTRKAVFNAELLMPFPGIRQVVRFGPFFDAGNVFTRQLHLLGKDSKEGLRYVGRPDGGLDFAAGTIEIQLWSADQRAK